MFIKKTQIVLFTFLHNGQECLDFATGYEILAKDFQIGDTVEVLSLHEFDPKTSRTAYIESGLNRFQARVESIFEIRHEYANEEDAFSFMKSKPVQGKFLGSSFLGKPFFFLSLSTVKKFGFDKKDVRKWWKRYHNPKVAVHHLPVAKAA